jgi:hypothetical protein
MPERHCHAIDAFATAKPDAQLVKLLIKARLFNATLLDSDGAPFAALAKRQGVSPSYFARLVRLSYLGVAGPAQRLRCRISRQPRASLRGATVSR